MTSYRWHKRLLTIYYITSINNHYSQNQTIREIIYNHYFHLLTMIIPQVTPRFFASLPAPQVLTFQGGLLSAEQHGHHAGEERKDPIDTWTWTRRRFWPTKMVGFQMLLIFTHSLLGILPIESDKMRNCSIWTIGLVTRAMVILATESGFYPEQREVLPKKLAALSGWPIEGLSQSGNPYPPSGLRFVTSLCSVMCVNFMTSSYHRWTLTYRESLPDLPMLQGGTWFSARLMLKVDWDVLSEKVFGVWFWILFVPSQVGLGSYQDMICPTIMLPISKWITPIILPIFYPSI